jgi:hypothetical protein
MVQEFMEIRPGTLGFPEIQASRNLLDRERRLLPQAGCNRQLGGMTLRPRERERFLRSDPAQTPPTAMTPAMTPATDPGH